MPKITVVITSYNLELFIEHCINGLISQTFQDFNILIIDDCSTDGTVDIVQHNTKRFPDKISAILLDKNLGNPARTRNVALDSGKIDGEYVIFLDGDDTIEPDYLETLYDLVLETDSDISICAYKSVEFGTGHLLGIGMQGYPNIFKLPPKDDILAFINTSLWNKLIRKSIINNIRLPDFRVCEDGCFLLMLYNNCKQITFTDKVLVSYLQHSNSIMSTTREEDVYALAAEIKKLYDESGSKIYKDTLGLFAFIHVGLSFTIRIYENPNINISKHLKWIRNYFIECFDFFNNNNFTKFTSLKHRGIRGYALWVCLILYKLRLFRVFLITYGIYKKFSKMSVKF